MPYAVGSNGTPDKKVITLGQNGLLPRFRGHIYPGQALGTPKPAPDLWLHAARALGVAPEDCVVIEESAVGAEAARRAGIPCFGYAPHGQGTPCCRRGGHLQADAGPDRRSGSWLTSLYGYASSAPSLPHQGGGRRREGPGVNGCGGRPWRRSRACPWRRTGCRPGHPSWASNPRAIR